MTLPDAQARAEGRASFRFVAFLALMTSVVAMTVDAILPALDSISEELEFEDPNQRQLVVILVIMGMGLSQPFYGSLADSVGRKPAALTGWAIYVAGTILALTAGSGFWMLLGRLLQGIGAGGPRVIAQALARDFYDGPALGRIVSLVMTTFMVIPIFAPLIGQATEALFGWRAIFGLYLLLAVISALWYIVSFPETLAPEHRRSFRAGPTVAAFREVLTTRQTIGCSLSAMLMFGPFIVYLSTAQQILEELYGLGDLFPLVFSSVALSFAATSFANSRLVMRFGMARCAAAGFAIMIGTAGLACLAMVTGVIGAVPPLFVYIGFVALIFVAVGLLMANLTALALDPMGHLAGTASAVVNGVAAVGASVIGLVIAQLYDGTLVPLFVGFLVLGVAAYGLFRIGMKT